jgi:hypothetical protein
MVDSLTSVQSMTETDTTLQHECHKGNQKKQLGTHSAHTHITAEFQMPLQGYTRVYSNPTELPTLVWASLPCYEDHPESKYHLHIAYTYASQYIVQTWPQSDFHLFPKLKEFLGVRHFKRDDEVKDAIKERLNGLVAEVYDEGIQEFITL